jgi:hypothetical protein
VEPIATPPPQRDPEFTYSGIDTGGNQPVPVAPQQYLRVVANPFLGLVGLLVWAMVVLKFGSLLQQHAELYGPLTPIIALILLASLALLPHLFQFHCLDCGATGRLGRWRRHACAPSALRRSTGQPRRFHGPTPLVQIILWLWFLLFICVLGDALGVGWLQR